MKIYKLVVLNFLIMNIASAGENYVIYMGGGGDPVEKKETIFDIGMHNASTYLNKSKNVEIIFDGGHEKTEKYLKNKFTDKKVMNFSKPNYYLTIEKYKSLIASGKIKAGDNILITIDTHGASNETKSEVTHQIATGNAQDGSGNVSVDSLSALIRLANSKGIKLAIADLSCHSGNSLKLANPNTCIISATGENHYSFKGTETFSAKFFDGLSTGRNLEEVFLEARGGAVDRSFPMISTAAGQFTSKSIYEGITPFLYSKNDSGKGTGSVDHYLFQNHATEAICLKQNQFSNLLKLIDQIEKEEKISLSIFNFQLSVNDSNYTKLKTLLKKMNSEYSSLLNEFNKYKTKLKKPVQVSYRNANNELMSRNYSMEEIISTDFDTLLAKEKNSERSMPLLINLFSSLAVKQKEILSKDKSLVGIKKKIELLGTKIIDSMKNSAFIAEEEKKIYKKIYEKYSKLDSKPNPCKDFIL